MRAAAEPQDVWDRAACLRCPRRRPRGARTPRTRCQPKTVILGGCRIARCGWERAVLRAARAGGGGGNGKLNGSAVHPRKAADRYAQAAFFPPHTDAHAQVTDKPYIYSPCGGWALHPSQRARDNVRGAPPRLDVAHTCTPVVHCSCSCSCRTVVSARCGGLRIPGPGQCWRGFQRRIPRPKALTLIKIDQVIPKLDSEIKLTASTLAGASTLQSTAHELRSERKLLGIAQFMTHIL
eukprot:7671-Chlamydomonas_euryale.AAC.6